MRVRDDRTEEQKKTHPYLVIGTDRILSGWGKASDGISVAAWACRGEDRKRVLEWVERRGDMTRIRENVDDGGRLRYRPKGRGDCHIYVVTENHPSVK